MAREPAIREGRPLRFTPPQGLDGDARGRRASRNFPHSNSAAVTVRRMGDRNRVARTAAVLLTLGTVAMAAPSARAQGLEDPVDQWLPRSDGAEWTYTWSNSGYSPAPKTELYRLQARAGLTFRVRWDQIGAQPQEAPSAGTMDFQHTDAGLVNLNYQSTPPPPQFPIL